MYRRSIFDLDSIFRDLDTLFTPRLLTFQGSSEPTRLMPAVESFAKDGRLYVRAELPGVDPANLHVEVTGSKLRITGEKKVSREVKESDVYFREISEGRFERNFTLPQGVKTE